MNAYTIRNHTRRTVAALLLISAGLVGPLQANASELDLSTEFRAAAEQAVTSIRDELKSQLDLSIQPQFSTDESLLTAATNMDEVVKQTPSVSRDDLDEAS